MSAEKTLDEKSNRRRRRKQADEPVDEVEMQDVEEELRGVTERKGRATPSRREQMEVEAQKETGNVITRPFHALGEYISGVRSEIAKVVWPTREDVLRLTWIVLGATIAAAIALGVIAFVFSELFVAGLRQPVIFVVLTVVSVVILAIYLRRSNRTTSGY
ncbi:MAG: preprotein translocase subunit SecE [Anaerolineae bacterium]|nr:preprotein translocase subunit SecE [Anaerolineae bacterium]